MNGFTLAACSAALAAVPPGTPQVELPIDTWLERAESLESLDLRYRIVNAQGDVHTLRVTLGGTERARFRFGAEDGTGDAQIIWIRDGVMTRVGEAADQPAQIFVLDFGACLEGPATWLEESSDALAIETRPLPDPRVQFRLWPSEEPGRTWNLQMSCGITRLSTFGWLEELRAGEHPAKLTEEGYVVALRGGAQCLLDRTDGFIRRIDIDPEDPSAGRVELLSFELDAEVDDELFRAQLPEGGEHMETGGMIGQQELAVWRVARFEWLKALRLAVRADANFIERSADKIEEGAARFYLECFADHIERTVESLKEAVDTDANRLLAAWEASPKDAETGRQVAAARASLIRTLTAACDARAAAQAKQLVVDPLGADDPAIERLLEVEGAAAVRALRQAFLEPLIAHMDERLDGLGRDGR